MDQSQARRHMQSRAFSAMGANMMWKFTQSRNHYALSVIGLIGFLSFFSSPESPEQAIKRFLEVLKVRDAAGFRQLIHQDVVMDKEVPTEELSSFLKRFGGPAWKIEGGRIDKELKSEDGETRRFQATLEFQGPALSSDYSGPAHLKMTLLWVLDEAKWWFERSLGVQCTAGFPRSYPTPEQGETATRFQAAMDVLDRLGLPGKEDLTLAGAAIPGTASTYYKRLEALHLQERSPNGIAWDARGVSAFLNGASRARGDLLERYHGDFRDGPDDFRKPVPWDMFRDYVEGAIRRAKRDEKVGSTDKAEAIYRKIISFGRQVLDEPGGLQFLRWGIAFQKRGAEELHELLTKNNSPKQEETASFVRLASRRLDLLGTALGCLDNMTDFKSLQAAILASRRTGDVYFRPWGINTLVIFSIKGAPAQQELAEKIGTIVRVTSPQMQEVAAEALQQLAGEPSGRLASFIETQKDWVRTHKVYGPAYAFY